MARTAACPKCRNQFTLPPLSGPATIACPFCQARITIKLRQNAPPPMMAAQPMSVGRAMPVEDDDYEEQAPRQKKKGKLKGKKKQAVSDGGGGSETGMKIAIVAGVFLLTICAIVFAFWWFLRDDGTPKIIPPKEISSPPGK